MINNTQNITSVDNRTANSREFNNKVHTHSINKMLFGRELNSSKLKKSYHSLYNTDMQSKSECFNYIKTFAVEMYLSNSLTAIQWLKNCIEVKRTGAANFVLKDFDEGSIYQLCKNKKNSLFPVTFTRGFQKTIAIGYILENQESAFSDGVFDFNKFIGWIEKQKKLATTECHGIKLLNNELSSNFDVLIKSLSKKYFSDITLNHSIVNFGSEYLVSLDLKAPELVGCKLAKIQDCINKLDVIKEEENEQKFNRIVNKIYTRMLNVQKDLYRVIFINNSSPETKTKINFANVDKILMCKKFLKSHLNIISTFVIFYMLQKFRAYIEKNKIKMVDAETALNIGIRIYDEFSNEIKEHLDQETSKNFFETLVNEIREQYANEDENGDLVSKELLPTTLFTCLTDPEQI